MPFNLPLHLTSWLRRAGQHPIAPRLLLHGSAVIAALCADARDPKDIDYLVVGAFDAAEMERAVKEIVAIPDTICDLLLIGTQRTFEYSIEFPGFRAHLMTMSVNRPRQRFFVDFAFGDPLSTPPHAIAIDQVGLVQAVAPETLFAWKLHTLIQFDADEWRPKDVYDMDVLRRQCPLDSDILRGAIELAFSSRYSTLDELQAFRTQPDWGLDEPGQLKWQMFQHEYAIESSLESVRTPLLSFLDHIFAHTIWNTTWRKPIAEN